MVQPNKRTILWSIFALFVISMNLRAAITSISPVLKDIQTDLHISSMTVSLLTSIPVFCMGIFAPVAGRLSDRWGNERTIALAVLLIGASTALRLVSTFSSLLLLTAVFAGIGIAIAGPLISGFIKEHFPQNSSAMIGIYSAGMGIGASLSAGLVVPVMQFFHQSWNIALAVWSVFAVMGILVWIPIMKKSAQKKTESALSPQPKTTLPWGNRYAWRLTLMFGLQSGTYYSFATWLAPKAQEMGYTSSYAATTATVFSIVQMVGSLIIPLFLDRNVNRKPWLILSAMSSMLGIVLLLTGMASPVLCAVLMGIGAGGLFPLTMILPLDETTTPKEASQWTAMIQFGGYLISGIVPIVVGAVKDMTNTYNYAFMALLFVFAAVILLSLKVRKKREAPLPLQEEKAASL